MSADAITQLRTHVGTPLERCRHTHGCTRPYGHHGAHEGASSPGRLARRWYSSDYCGDDANRLRNECHECLAESDAEVERLRNGGALRPGQREPDWLREYRRAGASP